METEEEGVNALLEAVLPTIKFQWMFFMIFIIGVNVGVSLMSYSKHKAMIEMMQKLRRDNDRNVP